MPVPVRLLLISGSLRVASTSSAALRTTAAHAPDGVQAVVLEDLAVLPHFNPDDDAEPLPPAVADLRAQIHAADAIIFSTPEYAGDLPGSFKNLLDWTIGDAEPRSLNGKPVAWINVSPRGAADSHSSLRRVLGYAGALVVEAGCAEVPLTGGAVGVDGLVDDAAVIARLRTAVGEVVAASRA